jgi:hypothetical protein
MTNDSDSAFFESKLVHYFNGETGTGKIRMVKNQMSIYKHEREWRSFKYPIQQGGTIWFDEYHDEEMTIINELKHVKIT